MVLFFKNFKEHFIKLGGIKQINSMFLVIGINRFYLSESENVNQDNLIPYIQKIFEPIMNGIHLLIDNINNFPVDKVISEIILGL